MSRRGRCQRWMSGTVGSKGRVGATSSMGRGIVAATVALLLLGRAPEAGATGERPLALDLPATAAQTPSTESRMLSMERRLASEEHRFAVWRGGWMLAYGGLAL